MSTKTAGQCLQEWRETAGFTQRQVAHEAGYSASFVSRVERGVVEPTKLHTLLLCVALGGLIAERREPRTLPETRRRHP